MGDGALDGDSDGECGELGSPITRRNRRSASSIPAAV